MRLLNAAILTLVLSVGVLHSTMMARWGAPIRPRERFRPRSTTLQAVPGAWASPLPRDNQYGGYRGAPATTYFYPFTSADSTTRIPTRRLRMWRPAGPAIPGPGRPAIVINQYFRVGFGQTGSDRLRPGRPRNSSCRYRGSASTRPLPIRPRSTRPASRWCSSSPSRMARLFGRGLLGWMAEMLNYITPQGKRNQMSIDLVDRDLSVKLNEGRQSTFICPPQIVFHPGPTRRRFCSPFPVSGGRFTGPPAPTNPFSAAPGPAA